MGTADNKERTMMNQLELALEALCNTTGLKGRVVALEPPLAIDRGIDARIEFTANNKKYIYIVEYQTRVDRFENVLLKNIANIFNNENVLLFTPYVTINIGERCREKNIQFLDMAGNVFLKTQDLFIFVIGKRQLEHIKTIYKEGATNTGVKTIFAFICNPDLLNLPYRKIAEAANVALGTVGWIIYDLKKRGYLIELGKNNRKIAEPKRLFDEWIQTYETKLRHKLNPMRFTAPDTNWWKNVNLNLYGALWGGEVAADKLTHYITPKTFTIYLEQNKTRDNLTRLITDNKLRLDMNGEVEILDAFWRFHMNTELQDMVHPILIYADLVHTMDPRNLETANLIYDKYIHNAIH